MIGMKKTGGLVHYIGGCHHCDKEWSARNVIGVASRHAKLTGHETWAEVGHSYAWRRETAADALKRSGK